MKAGSQEGKTRTFALALCVVAYSTSAAAPAADAPQGKASAMPEALWTVPLDGGVRQVTRFAGAHGARITVKNGSSVPYVIVEPGYGTAWRVPARSRISRTCEAEARVQLHAEADGVDGAFVDRVPCGVLLLIEDAPRPGGAQR